MFDKISCIIDMKTNATQTARWSRPLKFAIFGTEPAKNAQKMQFLHPRMIRNFLQDPRAVMTGMNYQTHCSKGVQVYNFLHRKKLQRFDLYSTLDM